MAHGGADFARCHAEAAVAHQADYRTFRAGELEAESACVGEPDQSKVERRKQSGRLVIVKLIGSLQTKGAGVHRKHRVGRRNRTQGPVKLSRLDTSLCGLSDSVAFSQQCGSSYGEAPCPVDHFGCRLMTCKGCHQAPGDFTRLAMDAQLYRKESPNCGGVEFDLDDLRIPVQVVVGVKGGVEAQTRAEGEDYIGRAGQIRGDDIASGTNLSGIERMRAGNCIPMPR